MKIRTRKFVPIKCPTCEYVRGTENELGTVVCQMCGEVIRYGVKVV